ncbi:MAG: DUF952 domain-containing protein [Devosia sp.]
MSAPRHVYKVASREVYETSLEQGEFVGQPIDLADGYIHLSTGPQLRETIRLYFAGLDKQVLFAVPVAPLGDELRWEASRGGDLFPHLYGDLPMALVSHVLDLDVPADGIVELPEWVQ